MKSKLCSQCKVEKELDKFEKDNRYKSGYRSQCFQCRYASQYESRRRSHLKRTYGITVEQYDFMLAEQNSVCAICMQSCVRRKRTSDRLDDETMKTTILSVDHNEQTGKVRGLLCMKCNVAVGMLNDDPQLAVKLAEYLIEKDGTTNE